MMTTTSTTAANFLFKNGVAYSPSNHAPPVTTFLETHPGAYTTTRTHKGGTHLLFWDRHITRLSNSLKILLTSNPTLIFGSPNLKPPHFPNWDYCLIQRHVDDYVKKAAKLPLVQERRQKEGKELAVTALVGGSLGNWEEYKYKEEEDEIVGRGLDVYVHIGMYLPPDFGVSGARLAVVVGRREFAEAKYSDWVRLRKPLEKMRPPSTTELLLSIDGDKILEGSVTNFFVVRTKGNGDLEDRSAHNDGDLSLYELQTAPLSDGVLPGVIRQLVIEICLSKGISVCEVSPSWSDRDSWKEAFVTSSLRLVQHAESIQAPSLLTSSKSWKEVAWVEKQFKGGPGMITAIIQGEILNRAGLEGCSLG